MTHNQSALTLIREALETAQQNMASSRDSCAPIELFTWDHYQAAIAALAEIDQVKSHDTRELFEFMRTMQAGEMTVSRGLELIDMWLAGNYSDDMLPPIQHPPAGAMPEGCMWCVTKGGRTICQPPRRASQPATKEATCGVCNNCDTEMPKGCEREFISEKSCALNGGSTSPQPASNAQAVIEKLSLTIASLENIDCDKDKRIAELEAQVRDMHETNLQLVGQSPVPVSQHESTVAWTALQAILDHPVTLGNDEAAQLKLIAVDAFTRLPAQDSKPVDCSNDPTSCPDNEGRGCWCSDSKQRRDEVIEECAKACEIVNAEYSECPELAIYCAEAIRQLKEPK